MKNKYVVAVSGGVDSMYLANKLAIQNQAAAFVHINHHTRGDANIYEMELVKKLGVKYEVPVYIFDFFFEGGNFQGEARTFRYQQLFKIARKYDHKIALAHHLDDQLENAMMPKHIVKSNLMSYRDVVDGIGIYRPLLGVSKANIYALAKSQKIVFNEDVSNCELKYNRNKIRHSLKISSNLHKAKLNYVLESNKAQLYGNIQFKQIEKKKLSNKSKTFRYAMLYNLIKNHDLNISVKNKQLIDIEKLVDKGKNCKYSLTNCVELFIGYDKIYMLAKDQTIITNAFLKQGENEFNGIKFESRLSQGNIRTWQPGDKVEIKNGHKKVARIFIDNKIDPNLRKCWPIIVNDRDQIIEIPKLWRKNEIN